MIFYFYSNFFFLFFFKIRIDTEFFVLQDLYELLPKLSLYVNETCSVSGNLKLGFEHITLGATKGVNDGQEEYSIGFSSSGSATPISYFFFRGKHWEISYDIQDLEFIASVKAAGQLDSVDIVMHIYLHEKPSDIIPASIPDGMPNDTYTLSFNTDIKLNLTTLVHKMLQWKMQSVQGLIVIVKVTSENPNSGQDAKVMLEQPTLKFKKRIRGNFYFIIGKELECLSFIRRRMFYYEYMF